jgi:hypothetical protein
MRRFALVSIGILVAACVKSETSTPVDTGTVAMAPAAPAPVAPAAAPIDLKTVAGKYKVTSRAQSGSDTSVVTYELNATGDTTGWTITYPNRKAERMRVILVSGDSIVTETGPFQSVRMKGVPVTTRTTYRWENGNLVGTTVAHYTINGADTVRTFILEGVKR